MSNETPVIQVNNLAKYFGRDTSLLDTLRRRRRSKIRAVDDVSITIHQNESRGIIGESGCGKTTLLMTLMGLHQPTEGQIKFKGNDLAKFSRKDWKEFRSNVQIIFQDPFNSLDPKMSVKEALFEPLKIHSLDEKEQRVVDILRQVELQPPEKYLSRFPKQLSGGERQRVAIARALILEPELILADEPVSMLDVSTQAQILNLLSRLINKLGVSMIYISHDISTVSYVCQDIDVMYLGRIVESAPTEQLIADPKHPYTQALITAVPIPDPHHQRQRVQLEGTAGNSTGSHIGCRFKDRCPERMEICENKPAFVEVDAQRKVACHLYYEHEGERL